MRQNETVTVAQARAASTKALRNAGVPAEHAQIQVDLLLEAQLRGRSSHGLQRLPRVIERVRKGIADPHTKGEHHWRASSLLDVNGRQGLGPVIAFHALEQITRRARETGVAVAAISGSNHLGMIALYAERVAAEGQILIAMTTSEALMHPWGGRTAMIGTNPIAIGVPAAPYPFVLDMATSLISMGQIHDYAHRGKPLEPGWALDACGEPTLDANAAKQGAIAPFGGAKGYALGLALEVLVAGLTGCAVGTEVKGTLDAEYQCNKGDLFIAIEPTKGGAAAQVRAYLDAIRQSPPQRADRPVLVPGDRAHQQRARSLVEGISLAPDVWRAICELTGESIWTPT
jgi:L-2-hydroxycarboxylate dehydrogenase (NAD+)